MSSSRIPPLSGGIHLTSLSDFLGPPQFDWEGSAATLTTYVDITDRKRAQDALVDRQRMLSMHLENTSLASTVWAADMSCAGWNGAAEKLFGFSSDEIMGRCAVDLIVPEPSRKDMRDIVRAAVERNGERQHRIENVTKDGRRITCEWSITPLVDDDGKLLGIASLVRDVTDTRREIEDLRAKFDTVGKANHDLTKCLVELKKEIRMPLEALSRIARSIDDIPDQHLVPVRQSPVHSGTSIRPTREIVKADAEQAKPVVTMIGQRRKATTDS